MPRPDPVDAERAAVLAVAAHLAQLGGWDTDADPAAWADNLDSVAEDLRWSGREGTCPDGHWVLAQALDHLADNRLEAAEAAVARVARDLGALDLTSVLVADGTRAVDALDIAGLLT